MSRQAKITKLQKNRARKAPEALADYAVLASVMEATVADFKKTLKSGVEINDLDVLVDRLEGITELKSSVDELKNAIKTFPALPEEVKIASVNEFLAALSEIKIQVPDIIVPEQKQEIPDYSKSVIKLAQAIESMAISIKANAPKAPSQNAKDFIPYRRVIKVGNLYKFDDEPTPKASAAAGGGFGVTTQHNAEAGETWGYNAGTNGTVTLTGSKRVLQITAIAQGAAGSFTINGGDSIILPYNSTDKVSSEITFEPKGNLIDPTVVFDSDVDAYVIEWVV